MSRIINPDNPGKARSQQMRTCAEILRHLSKKPNLDDEAKDMIAHLVYALRTINATIEQATRAWEDRDYWMKAEELRENWRWAVKLEGDVEHLVKHGEWDNFPAILAVLFQKVGDINVKKFTRKPDTWANAYSKLMKEFEDNQ